MTFAFRQNSMVENKKITEYLLNSQHPVGQHKAKFFSAFGFSIQDVPAFKDALIEHAKNRVHTGTKQNQFGSYFTVECNIECPDGRSPCIETVWELKSGSQEPRLVTAYPK